MERIAQIISILFSLILFFIGGLIYLAFRSESLLMFSWARDIGIERLIDHLRIIMQPYYPSSEWILFSLPDGLWTLSYVILMGAIWKFQIREHRIMIGLIPTIAICSELLQAFGIFPGSFDVSDLLTYIGSLLIGVFYCKAINHFVL